MGVSIYFKQLKTLIVMLLVFTLLSVPSYVLFWSAGNHMVDTSQSLTLNDIFFGLSLGNLGERNTPTIEVKYNDGRSRVQRVQLLCETGSIGKVTNYGVAMKDTSKATEKSKEVTFIKETFCPLSMSSMQQEELESTCVGSQFCSFSFTVDSVEVSKQCSTAAATPSTKLQKQYSIYLQYSCDVSTVKLVYFGEI